MKSHFEVFIVKSETVGMYRRSYLQSLRQHYSGPAHNSPVPGITDQEFDVFTDAQGWIDVYGEKNLTYTILEIFTKN